MLVKKYKNATIVIFGFCFLIQFLSCYKNGDSLIDGYYTAEAAIFNGKGWKDYIAICVSGGKIILVEYDAYNPSGFIRSWDMDYMRMMDESKGTYPNDYARYYGSLLIENQGVDGIDALSGASLSFRSFVLLAEAVLKSAREGHNRTVLIHFEDLL